MGRNGYKPSPGCDAKAALVRAAIGNLRGEQAEMVEHLMDRAIVHVKVRQPRRQFGRDSAAELVGKLFTFLARMDDDSLDLLLADNRRRCNR